MSNHNSCDTVVSSNEHGAPNHSQRSRGTVSRQPPGLRGSRAHIRCGHRTHLRSRPTAPHLHQLHTHFRCLLPPSPTACSHPRCSADKGAPPARRQYRKPHAPSTASARARPLLLAVAVAGGGDVDADRTRLCRLRAAPKPAAAAAIPVAQVRHQLRDGHRHRVLERPSPRPRFGSPTRCPDAGISTLTAAGCADSPPSAAPPASTSPARKVRPKIVVRMPSM